MPALVSIQALLLRHTRLCATTYSCYLSGYLSGNQGDFVSMARYLALCLAMVALLQVVPQSQQSGSIKPVPREAGPARKQVKRGSGACGLDTPTRLVGLQPGASEGTHQGNNGASNDRQVPPSAVVGRSRGRPENSLLPGCGSTEGESGILLLADQHESRSPVGSSRGGSRSPGPACSAEVDGTAAQGPTASRRAPSKHRTSKAHAATADRVQTRVRAKRAAEQGGGDGSACKVPRHTEGQTVRYFIEFAALCWVSSVLSVAVVLHEAQAHYQAEF
jgi:hypothetical protein